MVQEWFRNLRYISGLDDIGYRDFTVRKFLENSQQREEIQRLVRALDLSIDEIQVTNIEPSQVEFPKEMPDELKSFLTKTPSDFVLVTTCHKKYDEAGHPVGIEVFNLENEESEGTKKLFFLAGPVLDALSNGRVLLVDEMEARMHPLITRAVIRMFNALHANPKRAQIIFTTHNTNLLDRDLFRRDQVWFTEKDRKGRSHLYSLVEFKPRNDASFEKDYLRGKYGAIPYVGDLSRILEDEQKAPAEAAREA